MCRLLVGIVILGPFCLNCLSKVGDIQQAGRLRYPLFTGLVGAKSAKGLADIRLHLAQIIFGTEIPRVIPLISDFLKDRPQLGIIGLQFLHGKSVEGTADDAIKPGRIRRWDSTVFLIIHSGIRYLHGEIGGFNGACYNTCIFVNIRECFFRLSGVYDQGLIVDLQLIEVYLGQMEMIGAVIPSQRHFMVICFTKLFQRDMVLFQQLSV